MHESSNIAIDKSNHRHPIHDDGKTQNLRFLCSVTGLSSMHLKRTEEEKRRHMWVSLSIDIFLSHPIFFLTVTRGMMFPTIAAAE